MTTAGLFFLFLLFLIGIRRGKGVTSERKPQDDKERAKWGRGPLAGKTGDRFIDDPFFNPWAPGGSFNSGGPFYHIPRRRDSQGRIIKKEKPKRRRSKGRSGDYWEPLQ